MAKGPATERLSEGALSAIGSIIPASFIYGVFATWFFAGTGGENIWYEWIRDWFVISLAVCMTSLFVAVIALALWGYPAYRVLAWFGTPLWVSLLIAGALPGLIVIATLDVFLGGTILYFGLVAAGAIWGRLSRG